MTLFRRIVDDAAASGIGDLELNLYNEPLMDNLIFDRIKYAKQKGMWVRFFSNGTLLLRNDNVQGILDSGMDRIIFSVDGADRETYERIRVGAKFEEVINGIATLVGERQRLKHGGPLIEIYCVVQDKNYRHLSDLKNQFRKVFPDVDLIQFGSVDFRAREEELIPDSQWPRHGARFTYPCRRLWEQMYVLADGSVCLCSMDSDGQIVIGNLNERSLREIWDSAKFVRIRQLHLAGKGREIDMCSKCPELNYGALTRWWDRGL